MRDLAYYFMCPLQAYLPTRPAAVVAAGLVEQLGGSGAGRRAGSQKNHFHLAQDRPRNSVASWYLVLGDNLAQEKSWRRSCAAEREVGDMTRSELNDCLVELIWSDDPLTEGQRAMLHDALLDHGDERSAALLRLPGGKVFVVRNSDTGHIELMAVRAREVGQ